MRIGINVAKLREGTPSEYIGRFIFGGLVTVVACTLLPYEPAFELGGTLAEALRPVPLNHPHCARFCMLGGAACSR